MNTGLLRVLLVEDDEEDYILVRDLLSKVFHTRYALDWTRSYNGALKAMERSEHDVYLLSHRVEGRDGLALLREAIAKQCRAPVIFISLQGEENTEGGIEAIASGAADCLVGNQLSTALLERSICCAVEKKRAQEALRGGEEKYRAIVEDQSELICRFQPDGILTFVNEAYCRYFKKTREELIGKNFIPLIPPEDHDLVNNHIALLPSLTPENPTAPFCEHRVIQPNGEICWQQWRDRAIFDEHGRIIEFQSVGRDITERKKSEEKLKESEEKFRELAENIREVFWIRTPDEMLYVSPAYEEVWGRSRESLYERPDSFMDVIHPEDRQRIMQAMDTEHEHGTSDIEYRILRSDGTMRWIRARSFPVIKQGRVVRTVGIADDITERKKAEEALLRAHDILEKEVGQRTAELAYTNEQLRLEIEERRQTEEALRESEQHLRFLSSKLLSIQEEERGRLAQELHDSIGQALVAAKYRVENALHQPQIGEMMPVVKSLEAIVSMVQNSIEEIRRVCTGLRPFILDDFGAIAAIEWLCEEFQITCPSCLVEKEIEVEEHALPDPLKIVIFRIVQEALNNVAKHSKANTIFLSLRKMGDTLELIVKDNGIGFNIEETLSVTGQKKGFGLINMRERAKLSGGSFSVASAIKEGTTVRASWLCS